MISDDSTYTGLRCSTKYIFNLKSVITSNSIETKQTMHNQKDVPKMAPTHTTINIITIYCWPCAQNAPRCFCALFVLAREEVHLTGQHCLIVIPDPVCVGDGLYHARAVPSQGARNIKGSTVS